MTTTRLTTALLSIGLGLALVGCQDEAKEPREILENIDAHIGKRVTIKARLRAGIRCRLDTEDGEWQTYCRDCQVCKGPFVVDLGNAPADQEFADWPMIIGGTWKEKDIRCKGPLNEVECYPFEPGKTYVLEGLIERTKPPKLIVDGFKLVEG